MIETNLQKSLIINNRELVYKGIFRADEVFAAVNRSLEERGYEKNEKKSEEIVTDRGRKTVVELRPYKEKSSYVTLMIHLKLVLDNVKETVEVHNGQKLKYHVGDVKIVFDAYQLTDYQNRWMMQPFIYFVKGVINKYIYLWPLEASFVSELRTDVAFIYANLRKLFNSYKPETGKSKKENEILRDVEEEVKREIERDEGSFEN